MRYTSTHLVATRLMPYVVVTPFAFVLQRPFSRAVLAKHRWHPNCTRCNPTVTTASGTAASGSASAASGTTELSPPGCCLLPVKQEPRASEVGRVVRTCPSDRAVARRRTHS